MLRCSDGECAVLPFVRPPGEGDPAIIRKVFEIHGERFQLECLVYDDHADTSLVSLRDGSEYRALTCGEVLALGGEIRRPASQEESAQSWVDLPHPA